MQLLGAMTTGIDDDDVTIASNNNTQSRVNDSCQLSHGNEDVRCVDDDLHGQTACCCSTHPADRSTAAASAATQHDGDANGHVMMVGQLDVDDFIKTRSPPLPASTSLPPSSNYCKLIMFSTHAANLQTAQHYLQSDTCIC